VLSAKAPETTYRRPILEFPLRKWELDKNRSGPGCMLENLFIIESSFALNLFLKLWKYSHIIILLCHDLQLMIFYFQRET
jgi:hypothetical protein